MIETLDIDNEKFRMGVGGQIFHDIFAPPEAEEEIYDLYHAIREQLYAQMLGWTE